jgi:hypothetical protein
MRSIQAMDRATAAGIAFVLFDIDDTITERGRLPEESYKALWDLHRAGIKVIPVTGRPAGWCDLIARQWPVDGVVGENGAFAFFLREGRLERLLHPAAPLPEATRVALEALRVRLASEIPGLRIAKDQPYRLYDLALDFAEEEPRAPPGTPERIKLACEAAGAHAKISSIHVNAWFGDYDKLSMSRIFLAEILGWDAERDAGRTIFFGDSPNDEPMFQAFPLTCGVANVRDFAASMEHLPAFVTGLPYGRGFAEAVGVILGAR